MEKQLPVVLDPLLYTVQICLDIIASLLKQITGG